MTFKPVDTAIVMVVGPCIDDTDFKTLEEAIAYNAAGMDVSLIVEKTDGTTAVTAITLTTAGTSDWTHKDGGYYEIEVTAAQNAEEGIAYVRGVCTGVLPFESIHYNIVKANVYDSLIKGTDVLQTDVTQWLGTAAATPTVAGVPEVDITHWIGTAAATPTVAGVPEVDVTHWLGTAVTANIAGQPTVDITRIGASTQSLIDLKDFVDSGYDPVTNKVQGVVLADTVTALTGHTAQTGDSFARIGAAGASLTDLGGMSTAMKAEVNVEAKDVLTVDTIADSYATDGAQPTIAQAILAIQQHLQEKSISGTTLTVKKPDGSTAAMTFTLDSATAPTSVTRAT